MFLRPWYYVQTKNWIYKAITVVTDAAPTILEAEVNDGNGKYKDIC